MKAVAATSLLLLVSGVATSEESLLRSFPDPEQDLVSGAVVVASVDLLGGEIRSTGGQIEDARLLLARLRNEAVDNALAPGCDEVSYSLGERLVGPLSELREVSFRAKRAIGSDEIADASVTLLTVTADDEVIEETRSVSAVIVENELRWSLPEGIPEIGGEATAAALLTACDLQIGPTPSYFDQAFENARTLIAQPGLGGRLA